MNGVFIIDMVLLCLVLKLMVCLIRVLMWVSLVVDSGCGFILLLVLVCGMLFISIVIDMCLMWLVGWWVCCRVWFSL